MFFAIIILPILLLKKHRSLKLYQVLQMGGIVTINKLIPLSQLLLNLIPHQTRRIQLLRMPILNTPSPIHNLRRHNTRTRLIT
ncbi:hypothetical protein Hanom_Chr16g01458711 [Helianthus anomalus]